MSDPRSVSTALAHLNQRPRDGAHHVVQEGVAHHIDGHKLLASLDDARDADLLKVSRGRAPVSANRLRRGHLAEAHKVMLAHQALGGLVHGLCVEVCPRAKPPHMAPAQDWAGGITTGNAVSIPAGLGVKTGREARLGLIEGLDGDVFGRKSRQHALQTRPACHQFLRAYRQAHVLGQRMNARVRPASTRQLDRATKRSLQRTSQLASHRTQARLLRIAAELRPTVPKLYDERLFHMSSGTVRDPAAPSCPSNEKGPGKPRTLFKAIARAVYSATLVTSATLALTGSVTSSMITTSAASPLRGPSFMMRV